MIYLDLKRVMTDREIPNPYQFLKKCGVPAHTASRLLSNTTNSISFKHLETICLNLNCTIDDLCSWTPDTTRRLYNETALNKLKREQKKRINVSHKIRTLPLDKLDLVQNFIEQVEKGEASEGVSRSVPTSGDIE